MPSLSRAVAPLLLLVLVAALVGCDHGSKHIAKTQLEGGPAIDLIAGVLDLRYAENRGTAFNVLRFVPYNVRRSLLLATGATMVVLLAVYLFRRREHLLLESAALALILAGGIGNVADRALRGYVVDFIHLRHWPVFNFADVYLVVGVALFLLAARGRLRSSGAT